MVCPAAERATLDFLRTSYQTSRTKPRHDLFAACDLLTCDRHVATTTYAEANSGFSHRLQRSFTTLAVIGLFPMTVTT